LEKEIKRSTARERTVTVEVMYACTEWGASLITSQSEFGARGRREGAVGARSGHACPVPPQTGECKRCKGCKGNTALIQHAVGIIRWAQAPSRPGGCNTVRAGSAACERRGRRGRSLVSPYRRQWVVLASDGEREPTQTEGDATRAGQRCIGCSAVQDLRGRTSKAYRF
jgi:hypothetical protein